MIGFLGWAILLAGIVLIPFPGPGWAVVFVGFSILASEFDWAKEAKEWAENMYKAWRVWFIRQSIYIRILFSLLTFASAAILVWLVNGYGVLNTWLHLNQPWLRSPLVWFNT